MNAPRRLQDNLKLTTIKDGDNIRVGGQLSCCDQHDFEVTYHGSLKKTLLGGQFLQDDNGLILKAKCKNCSKELVVFSSFADGYDGSVLSIEQAPSNLQLVPYDCPKCSNNSFKINLEYEYLSEEEIRKEGIDDYENSFTWIQVSLECIRCGKTTKKFIDFETA